MSCSTKLASLASDASPRLQSPMKARLPVLHEGLGFHMFMNMDMESRHEAEAALPYNRHMFVIERSLTWDFLVRCIRVALSASWAARATGFTLCLLPPAALDEGVTSCWVDLAAFFIVRDAALNRARGRRTRRPCDLTVLPPERLGCLPSVGSSSSAGCELSAPGRSPLCSSVSARISAASTESTRAWSILSSNNREPCAPLTKVLKGCLAFNIRQQPDTEGDCTSLAPSRQATS